MKGSSPPIESFACRWCAGKGSQTTKRVHRNIAPLYAVVIGGLFFSTICLIATALLIMTPVTIP
jgi:hypothetical protein